MPKQIIHSDAAPKAIGPYSQAVRCGNTVYLAGQIGLDPNTMELAPGLDAVVADADAFATERDEPYLDRVFIPLLRSVGGFETALTLGLGSRLLVHDTGGVFDTTAAEASARATGAAERLRVTREKVTDADVVAWVTGE